MNERRKDDNEEELDVKEINDNRTEENYKDNDNSNNIEYIKIDHKYSHRKIGYNYNQRNKSSYNYYGKKWHDHENYYDSGEYNNYRYNNNYNNTNYDYNKTKYYSNNDNYYKSNHKKYKTFSDNYNQENSNSTKSDYKSNEAKSDKIDDKYNKAKEKIKVNSKVNKTDNCSIKKENDTKEKRPKNLKELLE